MNRKIGIYYAYWAEEWEADFLPYISKVKKLGFDQLEVQAAAVLNLSPEKREDLKKEADTHGIDLSYGIGLTADRDVVLNVEVINRFEQFLLNTAEEAVKYVEQIDNPYCRILLDTFHMNIEEDSIEEAIKLCGPYLSALHIGETNRKPPGCGRMPWKEIKSALDDINFTGPLVMEPFVRPGGQVGRDIAVWRDLMPGADLDEEAAKAVRFVRKELC
jgi:D-psicose/D-tagatose/L-ribulose 3-epimerase